MHAKNRQSYPAYRLEVLKNSRQLLNQRVLAGSKSVHSEGDITRRSNYQPKDWLSGIEQMREHWYRREGKTAYIHEEEGDNKTQVEHINVQPEHTGGKLDRNTTMTPDLKQEVRMTLPKTCTEQILDIKWS